MVKLIISRFLSRTEDKRLKGQKYKLVPNTIRIRFISIINRSSHNNNYSPTTPIMQHYQKVSAN